MMNVLLTEFKLPVNVTQAIYNIHRHRNFYMIMEISTNGIVYIIDTSYNIFLYYTPNIVKYYILF